MIKHPFTEHYQLKRDIATRSTAETVEPRVDPALAADLSDDRLVARNDWHSVIVCLPKWVYPSIEYGGAQFSTITTTCYNHTVDEIAASLEAAESMLGAQYGPALCYYGVLAGSCQFMSNTPERFLTDLQNGESIAATLPQSDRNSEASASTNRVLGVCVWPTTCGTFYLTARGDNATEDFTVEYGLLQRGTPLDTTPIEQFFDVITDEPPTHMKPWPLRQLTLSGNGWTPLPRLEPIDDAIVTPESNPALRLTHCGGNPVYAVPPDDIGIASDDPELDIYRAALQSISTLGYDMAGRSDPETYALDSIHILDTPRDGPRIVTGSLRRER